jgi:hypothetical protein
MSASSERRISLSVPFIPGKKTPEKAALRFSMLSGRNDESGTLHTTITTMIKPYDGTKREKPIIMYSKGFSNYAAACPPKAGSRNGTTWAK